MGNWGKILLMLSLLLPTDYPGGQRPWDVLIFVQQWPRTVCDKWLQRRNDNTCGPFPSGTWTIHGIWPTQSGTRGPNDCDGSRPFSLQEISSLERQLDRDWAPVENHGHKTYFWSHEWNKHGTCAVPVLNTQHEYFKQAIDWLREYNMIGVLQRAGISPGGSYGAGDILNGVRSVLGKQPQLVCHVNNNGETTILEVRICFDKSLQLVDCNYYCNCDGQVLYPRS